MSYPSRYQKNTEGELVFVKKNSRKRQQFTIWKLVFTLQLRILLRPEKFSFKRDTVTVKTVSKLKYLDEREKLRFIIQMKNLVLHSSVRNLDAFSEVVQSLILG